MALVTLPGLFEVPSVTEDWYGDANFTIDAAAEKVALIFQVPKTGTIDKVSWRVGTVTTSDTLKISLQTTTDGNPSGTLIGGSVTRSSLTSNTLYEDTLGSTASVTKGDIIALVVEFNSYVSGNIIFTGDTSSPWGMFPYTCHYYSSTWYRSEYLLVGFCVRYDDGNYAPIGNNTYQKRDQLTLNTGSSPDEYGLRFTLPFPCNITGMYAMMYPSSNAADFKIRLYEGTTQRAEQTIDAHAIQRYTGYVYKVRLIFNTPYEISKDTAYIMAIRPTTATNIYLRFFEWPSATTGPMGGMFGGTNWYSAYRSDDGAWSYYTYRRPEIGIFIDKIDDGTGGGASGGGLPIMAGSIVR